MINDDAHAPNRMHDEYTEYIYEIATKMKLNLVDHIEGIFSIFRLFLNNYR